MKKHILLFPILILSFNSIQSQWVRLGGLSGQTVYSVMKFNNKLYAALNPGGVQISSDNGVT